ncbi:MAG: glycoside hydrolase family 127 protein [Bacteroidota bacterium]|nr:glycoside hydrolase family 127 protein [Bacteroidota bacterium]MDP4205045.1 glycoside hydrolase family 127 protein [Bacteroidota bacterium]
MSQCRIMAMSMLLFLSSLGALAQNVKDGNYTAKKIQVYSTNAKALPSFIPLEIGEIKPTGWLKDWATDAANGITGHLDEYVDVFKHGWKGYGFKALGVNEDGTGWPIEQCSYWLDGGVKLAYILNDTSLIRKTSSRLNMVINGVLNGGESFIYWKPKSVADDWFNNWGHGLMGRALVSYYQATHDPKIMQALQKVYHSFTIRAPQDTIEYMPRGATNIDAMTETYLMSGDKTILDKIVAYSKINGIITEENRWFNKRIIARDFNHGVTFYETLRVPAMMYPWTGNAKELYASQNVLEWGEKQNLLPVGICSSQEFLAGIGSFRDIETCNVPTSMWSFLWMMRLTGERNWGDRIEKIFFNAAPAPISRDFKTMCYFQTLNRFSSKLPVEIPGPKDDFKYTNQGCEVLCCVGNCNNIIPDYISSMWMATMDDGLAATLYGPCKVAKQVKNEKVTINCNTTYPFGDQINMTFSMAKAINMPIYLRIPGWCNHPSIKVNGKEVAMKTEKGFVKIARTWKSNDNIQLHFPMTVRIQKGRETPYPRQTDYFVTAGYKENVSDTTIHNPYECITYGPLLFSFPIPDLNPNQESANTKFNYALDVDPKNISKQITVIKKSLTGKWLWQLDAPIQLKVKAKQFDWNPTPSQPLPATPVKDGGEATIDLVPYGCTKFRVTMFPVTEKSWDSFKTLK